MMKHKTGYFLCLLLAGVLFAACEKPVIEDELQGTDTEAANVVIRVTDVEAGWGNNASRALTNVSDVCTRIAFVVYKDSKRVDYKYQHLNEDEYFGTYTAKLDEGKYQLLVVAHSGKNHASISKSAPIVTFSNPMTADGTGFTDTFYYYGDMTVNSEGATVNVSMKRATAMFRLVTTDAKPDTVKKFQFYYTGGSGVLNAETGCGNVDSKQSVFVTLDDSLTGKPLQLDMYTFLKAETGKVTFTVRVFDSKDDCLSKYTKEFKDVEMQCNYITRYTGAFFTKDEPDVPDIPDTPDNPDDPDPNNPDNPDTPDNPDNPDNPNNPDTPETPDTPDNPDNPDKPDPNPGPGPAVPVIQIDPEWGGVLEYNF